MTSPGSTRFRWLPSAIAVAAVSASLVAVAALSTPSPKALPANAPTPVLVNPAAWQDSATVATRYLGQVRARQRVDLSFDLSSRIERIDVDDGEQISAGTVVATLDTTRLRANLGRLRAAAEAVRSDLSLARLTLSRVERSVAADAANEQESDEARASVQTLEARLAEAEAAISRTEVDLDESTLRAPFDALVARRHADVGSLAQPGTPIVTLLELASPEVRVGVAPDAVQFVSNQTSVVIRGNTFRGTVVEILPELDRVTRTAEIRLMLEEPLGSGLRDGDAAELSLSRLISDQGVWVPLSALTQSVRGLWALYIAVPEDDTWTIERREVEVVRPDSGRAFVRGPIQDGDLIVIDGKQRLVPGMAVAPERAQ